MKTEAKQTATEVYPNKLSLSFLDCTLLERVQSQYQLIEVYDHSYLGKLLFIDHMIMFSELDYKNNREMMVNIALHCRPPFKRMLIVGGGDGSSPGEVVKYPYIEDVDVVDIDRVVTEVCRRHFTMYPGIFNHPKVHYLFEEGLSFVKTLSKKNCQGLYGGIVVSPTDPDSLSKSLFTREFFESGFRILDPEGVLCIGGFSPYYQLGCLKATDVFDAVAEFFPFTSVFTASVPTYPGGLAAYVVGSKKRNPAEVHHRPLSSATYAEMSYYNCALHAAAFCLPNPAMRLFDGRIT